MFALELHRAECEFLTGELAAAESAWRCFRSAPQITVIAPLSPACAWTSTRRSDQSDRAIDVGLDYLRHLGIDWSPHPTEEEARREYEQIWSQLGSRTIEELLDLPLMTDPDRSRLSMF